MFKNDRNKFTARLLFKKKQREKLFALLILILYFSISFPKISLIIIFGIGNFLFLSSFCVKSLLFIIGFILKFLNKENNKLPLDLEFQKKSNESNLPIYSLLIPLYKEAEVVTYLIHAIKQINYPIEKLDIKLILEEDDTNTLKALEKLNLQAPFQIIIVPFSLPRTKAKACNYVLPLVKGKYLGIYDAEDIPDPDQLRKVIEKFSTLSSEVICIQAKLNYFNRNENILTKLFSLEYLVWFDFILPALQYLNLPIPLGGTSNHFITEKLRELEGWDAYNVTEDAELSIRIARAGYKTCVIESLTLEESPVNIDIWFKQRSRWVKGYMQTYIVHMRNPIELYRAVGLTSYIGIQFFLGIFTLSFILNPFAIISWLIFMSIDNTSFLMPIIIIYLWKINLIVTLLNIIKFKVASKFIDINISIFIIMLFPLYFLMISISSFKALWELIFKPCYWDKTTHGLTRYRRKI